MHAAVLLIPIKVKEAREAIVNYYFPNELKANK